MLHRDTTAALNLVAALDRAATRIADLKAENEELKAKVAQQRAELDSLIGAAPTMSIEELRAHREEADAARLVDEHSHDDDRTRSWPRRWSTGCERRGTDHGGPTERSSEERRKMMTDRRGPSRGKAYRDNKDT